MVVEQDVEVGGDIITERIVADGPGTGVLTSDARTRRRPVVSGPPPLRAACGQFPSANTPPPHTPHQHIRIPVWNLREFAHTLTGLRRSLCIKSFMTTVRRARRDVAFTAGRSPGPFSTVMSTNRYFLAGLRWASCCLKLSAIVEIKRGAGSCRPQALAMDDRICMYMSEPTRDRQASGRRRWWLAVAGARRARADVQGTVCG
ncbi:hypothetical protein MRB53_039102 [Persea americana]|nr:hypothetical protein MRB53_039102 [Persea americana]